MVGRSYSSGFEQDLEDWLLRRPRRTVLNPAWPWAVWYPLRRTGAFAKLSPQEQGAILREHGTIGRAYGDADLAHDIRLACHGLDTHDNDFLIGLVGKELQPLSHLVQTMRKTVADLGVHGEPRPLLRGPRPLAEPVAMSVRAGRVALVVLRRGHARRLRLGGPAHAAHDHPASRGQVAGDDHRRAWARPSSTTSPSIPTASIVATWGMNWQWGKLTANGGEGVRFELSHITSGTLLYYDGPSGKAIQMTPDFGGWYVYATPRQVARPRAARHAATLASICRAWPSRCSA